MFMKNESDKLKLNTNMKYLLCYGIFLSINFLAFYVKMAESEFAGLKTKLIFVIVFAILGIIPIFIFKHINSKYKNKNKEINVKPEIIFLIVAILFGTIYTFATPLFKGHDEQYHFYRSYEVATGKFTTVKNEDGYVGNMLPQMVGEVYRVQGNFQDINYRTALEALEYSINEKEYESSTKEGFIDTLPTASYPPFQMLPQAVGISLGRLTNSSVYIQAMLGRVFNFIFFLVTGYFAIKLLPKKKYVLLLILLSPKVLYISTTLSSDILLNGCILLFITTILNLKYNKTKINLKKIIVLALTSICIGTCKIVYIPLILLVFLIPKESFKNKKTRTIILVSIILIMILAAGIWISITKLEDRNNSSLTPDQISFVLKNPVKYSGILVRNVINNSVEWTFDMLGGYMQWGTSLSQPEIITMIILLLIIITTIFETEETEIFNNKDKILVFSILILIVTLILTAMYVDWTPKATGKVGSLDIVGVQGRYFTPIFILFSLLVSSKLIKTKLKINYNYVYIIIILSQIPSLLNIIVNNI